MNGQLWRGVFIGGLAGLLFGFDTAVISGATEGLRAAFMLNDQALGFSVAAALWGTLLGALVAGIPGDRYGARDCLRAIGFMYLLSTLGCFFAHDVWLFNVSRFVSGLAIGASSVLAPTYLTEIAPAKQRGAMVGVFQLNIVIGILVAYLSNFLIGLANLGADEWRWKFVVAAVPSLLLIWLLSHIAQSPRWLAAKGRTDEAILALTKMGHEAPETAMAEFGREEKTQSLSLKHHLKPILLAVGIALFNQLSGINAILYYLNDIFAAAGFSKLSADVQAVSIGATNLVFTLIGLSIIDRFGRKKLLIWGSFGLIAALLGTAYIQLTGTYQAFLLPMLVLFIAAFAFSQGAVIWVYIAELFPTAVRARGQALGSSTHWLMNALIAQAFPIAAAYSKGLPFLFFAACMGLQLLVVWKFFPETKGVALEDMQTSLRG